jgi:hypothetical protein
MQVGDTWHRIGGSLIPEICNRDGQLLADRLLIQSSLTIVSLAVLLVFCL